MSINLSAVRSAVLVAAFGAGMSFGQTGAADGAVPTAGKVFENQLRGPESEVVSLVEAMPDQAFSFKPRDGAFEKSRTFAQQAKHIAFVNYQVAAVLIGEANPSTTGANENGPDELTTKEQIVKYVKDSFAYCHKAMAKMTSTNLMEMIPDAFDSKRNSPRVASANVILWHTFDHYGQMVIYARMNNVVPPASR